MNERLLQFIWQFQYFNRNELCTTEGQPVEIISTGLWNTNQGPDFLDAKIRTGSTLWAGTVELHILASDWGKHLHDKDSNYRNVILHVVWEDDTRETFVPVVELKSRVPKVLLKRYQDLMDSQGFIPCENSIVTVQDIVWKSWKERLMAERLLKKAATIEEYCKRNHHHWEETLWWALARNFGMKVNADAFEAIARSIPGHVFARHKNNLHQLESLLFGQAGLLDRQFREKYPKELKKEYRFLQHKYKLGPVHMPLYFLRMRPSGFPTLRLAELAMLVHQSEHLFASIKEAENLAEVRKYFTSTSSSYWDNHYRFGERSSHSTRDRKRKGPGADMIDNIIINTLVPVLFAYGQYLDEQKYTEKAVSWLEQTAPENNSITRRFRKAGIENDNAYDSQALIELNNEYCRHKRCLDCSVGNALLKKM